MNKKSTIGDAKEMISDTTITSQIKAKYLAESVLKGSKIHVTTQDGSVTLKGLLSSSEDINNAIKIAIDTQGVKEVVSELKLED